MTANRRVYLDHAATTPISAAAREACGVALAEWANPSSPHGEGRAAQARLEQARRRIAAALDWSGEVIFTSCASEAIQIAVGRTQAKSRITSPVEHDAMLRAMGKDARRLSVDANGQVRTDSLEDALAAAEAPALVAIQSVNNETGVIQDLPALGAIVREAGGWLLADCAQSAGKIVLPDAELITLSAHKFGGPPGVGALLTKSFSYLRPGGGQEQGYRAGTQNLPYIEAMAAALEQGFDWMEQARQLRAYCDERIVAMGGALVAAGVPRLPSIGSYRMPGVASNAQLIRFDIAGFSVSAGSACSSGTLKPSHVLSAMGMEEDAMREVLRVSIGRETSRADIDAFLDQWQAIQAGEPS